MDSRNHETNGSFVDVFVTAGENLDANDYVFVATVTVGTYVAGMAHKVPIGQVSYQEKYTVGFALANASAGNTVRIRIIGIVSGFSGLTVGGVQYSSSTTAGKLEEFSGIDLGSIIAGIAVATDQVLINTSCGDESGVTP
jgi:hypothetical protein